MIGPSLLPLPTLALQENNSRKTGFLSDILIEIGIVKRLDSPSSEITEWITEEMRHLINSYAV